MSIPYPLNNPKPSQEDVATAHTPLSEAPVKPFRAAIAPKKSTGIDPRLLRAILDDNKELKRALVNGAIAVCIIAGSIVAKEGFTYASLGVLVLTIFALALVDTWNAILLFFVYLALEGMYKYTSNYNPVVYIMAPLLSMTIFVAWRITARGQAERRQAVASGTDVEKPTLFQNARAKQDYTLPSIAPWVLGLIILSFLQTANPDSPGFINSLNGAIVWYIGPMSFFFVTFYAFNHRKQAMAFLYTLLVTGFVVSAYAVFQFNMGEAWVESHVPGSTNLDRLDYIIKVGKAVETAAYRPISTAAIAGGYVHATSIAILAALSIATMARMQGWRRTLALLSTSILVIGMSVSSVRLSILSLCVAIPVLFGLAVRRFEDVIRIYFMVFIVGALLSVSFVIADNAAEGKLSKRYGSVFTTNPLASYSTNRGGSLSLLPASVALRPFGIGIRRGTKGRGIMMHVKGGESLNDRETQWNCIQLDLGVFGLICLIGFVGITINQGWKICLGLQDPNLRSIAVSMYAIFLYNAVATFGGPSLQTNYVFWSACGILYAMPRIAAAERKLLLQSVGANDDVKTPAATAIIRPGARTQPV